MRTALRAVEDFEDWIRNNSVVRLVTEEQPYPPPTLESALLSWLTSPESSGEGIDVVCQDYKTFMQMVVVLVGRMQRGLIYETPTRDDRTIMVPVVMPPEEDWLDALCEDTFRSVVWGYNTWYLHHRQDSVYQQYLEAQGSPQTPGE